MERENKFKRIKSELKQLEKQASSLNENVQALSRFVGDEEKTKGFSLCGFEIRKKSSSTKPENPTNINNSFETIDYD